jgi:hypothetical protein
MACFPWRPETPTSTAAHGQHEKKIRDPLLSREKKGRAEIAFHPALTDLDYFDNPIVAGGGAGWGLLAQAPRPSMAIASAAAAAILVMFMKRGFPSFRGWLPGANLSQASAHTTRIGCHPGG